VEVFLWGHERGFTRFDFGGAGKPNVPYGVRDYKLKFGGELVNTGRMIRIHRPFNYAFATKAYRLLQVVKKSK
jgi:lipid II:glycine glycyltransferase (peptidoglycan interpeptide bridge formation enzyme)